MFGGEAPVTYGIVGLWQDKSIISTQHEQQSEHMLIG